MQYDLTNLCFDLQLGREIELHLFERHFFISWNHSERWFEVYDEEMKEIVFSGALEKLIDFPFLEKYQLSKCFDVFVVDYVL